MIMGLKRFSVSKALNSINLFLTLKQLNEIGGEVLAGEKPHIVTYWKKEVMEDPAKPGEKKINSFVS